MSLISESILKTLTYSDIFDFPLTTHEVWEYLIGDTKTGIEVVQKSLGILTDAERLPAGKAGISADADSGFFFFKGREEIVALRKKREKWSEEKLRIAQVAADKLGKIPTIKMIGVTGALAMNNCKEDDDIDLIIITSASTLWLTRILITFLCPVLGIKRRKPKDKEFNNKICFNLFLDENHLKIQPENLYLAHEIVQVKPIYDKDNTCGRFMEENRWIKNYLPNSIEKSKIKNQKSKPKLKAQNFFSLILECLNEFAYKLQFEYMKPKITIERVSLHQAFFHPGDLQNRIEKEYKTRIKQLVLDNS